MSRHAYLIVTNSNFKVLETCLRLIDDERNDIYILYDKKAHVSEETKSRLRTCVQKSNTYKECEQIVNWGGFSQIDAVLHLICCANHSEVNYDYIHFMQGSDLPIKPQDEIHHFFEKFSGYEFVSVEKSRKGMAENKAWYRHYFCHNRFFRKNKVVKALNFTLVAFQKMLGLQINRDISLWQGSALFSITGECAKYIETMIPEIRKRFRYSLAADEVFLQTILMNSSWKNQIWGIESAVSSNARMIDRTRPDGKNSPHIWRMEELENLLSLPEEYCFARKFDEKVDLKIVENLFSMLK